MTFRLSILFRPLALVVLLGVIFVIVSGFIHWWYSHAEYYAPTYVRTNYNVKSSVNVPTFGGARNNSIVAYSFARDQIEISEWYDGTDEIIFVVPDNVKDELQQQYSCWIFLGENEPKDEALKSKLSAPSGLKLFLSDNFIPIDVMKITQVDSDLSFIVRTVLNGGDSDSLRDIKNPIGKPYIVTVTEESIVITTKLDYGSFTLEVILEEPDPTGKDPSQ